MKELTREEIEEMKRFIECSRETLGEYTTLNLKLIDSAIKKLNLSYKKN